MEKKKDKNKPTKEIKKQLPDLFDKLPEDLKPVLVKLPEEEREKAARIILTEISMEITKTSFSGPLPHPSILKGYEEVLKGSAERIFKMAENQSAHRQEIEKTVIASQMKQSERGQNYGLGIGIFGLIIGTILTFYGFSTVAGVLFATTILGLVSVFVIGKVMGNKGDEKATE